MSAFSQQRGPVLAKGAFVSRAAGASTPTTVVFQYNPASLRRTVTPQMVGGETGDRSELVRFTGAPIETITLDVEIDAIDELAAGDATATSSGIGPQLAALELLAYPSSAAVEARQQQLAAGTIEVGPMAAPAVQFVWGTKRVLPVRILGFQVTEEDFDQNLNPIRATVGITMRVLTYSDVASDVPAYDDFLTYQRSLESMATQAARQGGIAGGRT
jgi:hypothetical protein